MDDFPIVLKEDVARQLEESLAEPSTSRGHKVNSPMLYRHMVQHITCDMLSCVKWLFSMGLMSSEQICPVCGAQMRITRDKGTSDGVMWQCRRQISGERHTKKVSIRKNSWFSQSHMSLEAILTLTYAWVWSLPADFVRMETQITQKTQIDWFSFCREVCLVYMQKLSEPIGGPGTTVEVDESKFGKRKYHCGRRIQGQWVICGIEMMSTKMFLVSVEDRSMSTLSSLVHKYIKPETTIITDCSRLYENLSNLGFTHLTVNHSENIVDPNTGAHTNTTESAWQKIKTSLSRCGVHKKHFASYLAERMWRLKVKDMPDRFCEFINAIRQVYPLAGDELRERETGDELGETETGDEESEGGYSDEN